MRLADPDVSSNNNEYQKIAKSLAELEEIYQTYQRFKECEAQLEDAQGKFSLGDGWLIRIGLVRVESCCTEFHGKGVGMGIRDGERCSRR